MRVTAIALVFGLCAARRRYFGALADNPEMVSMAAQEGRETIAGRQHLRTSQMDGLELPVSATGAMPQPASANSETSYRVPDPEATAASEAVLAPLDVRVQTCPATSKLVNICIDSGMWYAAQSDYWWIPPDPIGAAGLNSLIAVTNVQIEGIRKDGTVLFNATSLYDMFSSSYSNKLFDPKIIYDVHENRFVVVVLEKSPMSGTPVSSSILLAISKTDDPLSVSSDQWHKFKFDSFFENRWADYPGIAVDEEAIYITVNLINTDSKSMLWIVPKTPLYDGQGASASLYDYTAAASDAFYGTHMPAMVRKPGGVAPGVGTYLIMYDGLSYTSGQYTGNEAVQIVKVNSPLNDPTFEVTFAIIGDIESEPWVDLNDAPQKDTARLIWTGDRNIYQAVWVNNQLWATTTAGDGAETAAYWLKLQANGIDPPTLVDKGKIDGENIRPGTFTAFPSLDVNSKGVAAFGFAAYSSSFYASAYATIRANNGTVFAPDLVRAGFGPYFFTDNIERNRWGDYSGMSLDPANENCFWTFNEFAGPYYDGWGNGRFGMWLTAWARLCYSEPSCLNVGQRCSAVTECCAPANVCSGSPKTCQVCRSVGQQCSLVSECCAPANFCTGPVGGPKACQVCRGLNEECSSVSECCAPANLCKSTNDGPKTCQVCKSVGQQCSLVSECCAPANFCTGPVGGPKACQVCRGLNEECSSVSECCAPANLCKSTNGGPKTCQVCRSVGQQCSSVAECCAPANICEGQPGRAKTCQTCKAVGKPCLRYTQCCSPSNKVCEGPPRRAKTCSRCLPRNAVCARTTQCCRGYKCKNRRCLP